MPELTRRTETIHGETRYCVVGPEGAVDFHFSAGMRPGDPVCAGLEIHSRTPMEWQTGQAPRSDRCWLLDGPCWCDGTSLYATEHLYPLFQALGVDGFWIVLEREYRDRFPQGRTDARD